MRILIASNHPELGTGYGTQTAQLTHRLRRDGHDVAIATNAGSSGFATLWGDDVPIFPNGLDIYGNDAIPFIARKWQAMGGGEPTMVLTIFDVWVYKDPQFDSMPIASWVPIDHTPVPPEVLTWCEKHTPIAMSRFGQQSLANLGVASHYAPHAIDTSVFRPSPSAIREQLQVPDDAFLVMINAANKGNIPPRKAWGEMLVAFGAFAKRHDDAYLYINTDLTGNSGVPLRVLLQTLPIGPDRVSWAPQLPYRLGEIAPSTLAELYSASDVLLATSFGEGFGVPVIEAQACGTPVIVNNVTAQPELCGAGWQTRSQPYWDYTQGPVFFGIPIIESIVEQLEAAYAAKGDQALRDKAVAFAADYDADLVYERDWKPILAELDASLHEKPAKANRAERRRKKRAA